LIWASATPNDSGTDDPIEPNQKWITDVIYVSTQQGWSDLPSITDLFDGFIGRTKSGVEPWIRPHEALQGLAPHQFALQYA